MVALIKMRLTLPTMYNNGSALLPIKTGRFFIQITTKNKFSGWLGQKKQRCYFACYIHLCSTSSSSSFLSGFFYNPLPAIWFVLPVACRFYGVFHSKKCRAYL